MNLRYQKTDRYGSEIFIVSPKYPEEKEAYDSLLRVEDKLKGLGVETFLPVFSNDDLKFATIRFKFYKGLKLVEKNLYTVKFDVKKSERGGIEYINCFINNIKLHTKTKPHDSGIILDLGLF